MSDAEFESIINRQRLFDKESPIPLEASVEESTRELRRRRKLTHMSRSQGEMYDVVVPPENAVDMLSGMG